jgi:hypothetical protein
MSNNLEQFLDSSGRVHGRVVMVLECLSPLVHGGGTEGNIALARRHAVIAPDGSRADVPFLSGNSIKHMLRERGTLYGLEYLGALGQGSLTRSQIQLLISGGTLSKGGQSIQLEAARKMQAAFPVLSLHGYSAGNIMTESSLAVGHAELVCWENSQRLGAQVKRWAPDAEGFLERYASGFVSQEFGTRHEPTRNQHNAELLISEERSAIEEDVSKKQTVKNPSKGDSAQMIYEHEAIIPGAVLIGGLTFPRGLTMLELAALRSGLRYWAQEREEDGALIGSLGGKSAAGFGRVRMRLFGQLAEGIEPRRLFTSEAFCGALDEDDAILKAYGAHMDAQRETWRGDLNGVLE